MSKELWISSQVQKMDSMQVARIFLKENKLFWIYLIIIASFLLFLPVLSGFDVGLGILLLFLGGSHFFIQYNQINTRYNQCWGFNEDGYFQVDRSGKRFEVSWDHIVTYTFNPDSEPSLVLTIRKEIQLIGKVRSFEEKIILSPEDNRDALIKILDQHLN
jgi:hypothetical protein